MKSSCYTCAHDLRVPGVCPLPCKEYFLSCNTLEYVKVDTETECKFGKKCHRIHDQDQIVGSFIEYPDKKDKCLVGIRVLTVDKDNQRFVGFVVAYDKEPWHGKYTEKQVYWWTAPKFRFTLEPHPATCPYCRKDKFYEKCVLPCRFDLLKSVGHPKFMCRQRTLCHFKHNVSAEGYTVSYTDEDGMRVTTEIEDVNKVDGEITFTNGETHKLNTPFFSFEIPKTKKGDDKDEDESEDTDEGEYENKPTFKEQKAKPTWNKVVSKSDKNGK